MNMRNLLRFLLLLLFFLALLFEPAFASEATLSRLLFFVRAIFPSLFVSLCLSGVLVASPPAKALYRFPFGVEGTVLLLGIFCGFPVGARSALLLYENGQISKKRAEFLCGFSNLASLPFLTGVVGNALFGDLQFGVKLALLQLLSALLVACVLYGIFRPCCCGLKVQLTGTGQSLVSSIGSSAHTMLELGGMLIFFGVAADTAVHLFGLTGWKAVLTQGTLEFSSGCAKAASLGGETGRMLAALAVGFSGFCVLAQVSSVTKGKLSLRPYLLGKLLQAAFLAVFATVLS